MQIDLSKHELEFIDQALQAYEHASDFGGSLCSMLVESYAANGGAVPEEAQASLARVKKKVQVHKTKALLLLAKLIQARNREYEHNISGPEITET